MTVDQGPALTAGTLSPLQLLAGRHILLTGTTGFLAKLLLAMLLERFAIGKVYCLIRGTRSKSAQDRLQNEVLTSEVFQQLEHRFGPAFKALIQDRVEAIAGDISEPNLGLDDATKTRLQGEVDLVINSAGLVNFNPPLDNALEVNTIGAEEIARFAAGCKKARLVHISTCFVAGARSGRIREDTPIPGYCPRQEDYPGVEFDWKREVKDLKRIIETIKGRTDDAAMEASFKKEALDRLKEDGREAHERTVRAAITNQRRRWQAEEQIRAGIERAQHWGWPNIYTLTKALGEQAVAAQEGLDWAIVRPAIVESTISFPFPGWNQGMNTSAPLAYMGIHGQVFYPGPNDLILDVIPVDYVASAILAAAAALVAGESKKVYQVATGDVNPCSMARVVTLVGLYKRRYFKQEEKAGNVSRWKSELAQRTATLPIDRKTYERFSAPTWKKLVGRAKTVLDDMEPERYGPFGSLVSEARKVAKTAETELGKVVDVFDLFMPFIWENKYVFRTNQTRALFERMNEADRALLPYRPADIDWRHYWLEVHLPGLEKWVFPDLEPAGPKRVAVTRDYRDLVEMFNSRTQEHSRRTAFRILHKDDVADSYSYRDVQRAAGAVAEFLEQHGVGKGDRVMLASEGRPEWGMSYFGILLVGATAVPVDVDLSKKELANICKAAGAKAVLASPKQAEKLTGKKNGALTLSATANGNGHAVSEETLADTEFPAPVYDFELVFADASRARPIRDTKRKPEDAASIIFTSGTTGKPKGVVLTDRNFTALTARMSALFELNRLDSLLSVLPPHHTFEFSVGLLMPLSSGASVTYLEERTPELLSRAFEETPVTGLIGVPAVWESLHRKLNNGLKDQGPVVELAVRGLMRLNRILRDRLNWNFGRWLFRPMHNALGGRMRYLVSGAAPLKPEIYEDLRGYGFNIYEGYGLTEASPVLTVGWPGMVTPPGSVGWPLPGIEVRIDGADDAGIGEVIARGPTIMSGYLDDPDSTKKTVVDGWLRTGDRGKLDDEGRLYIVGREKDVIIDTGGKNVYPDEIEELYTGSPLIKELSVVGVPAESGPGERVAALVVPDYEASIVAEKGWTPDEVRERIREHFREVGAKLPFARRVKIMHLWEGELPKTSTRKTKRSLVRDEIVKLEATLASARQPVLAEDGSQASPDAQARMWVRRTIAAIAQRDVKDIHPSTRLADGLGFDSLMNLELYSAMEAEFPRARVTQEEMNGVESVEDVTRLALRDRGADVERVEEVGFGQDEPLKVPRPIAQAGKALLGLAQRLSYDKLLDVEIEGQGNIPANRNFIVASNHASHLDMGLVKYALGVFGDELRTLAAKDYFFDDSYRRTYFENFTNLLPMDRHGSLKKSLRLASEALRGGQSLLIFPEGTRSRDGVMTHFKPALGHLCLNEKVDLLPMYLGGTHDAMPVGAFAPKSRKLSVKIGAPITAERMLAETKGMAKSAAYRHVARTVEQAVREMGGLSLEAVGVGTTDLDTEEEADTATLPRLNGNGQAGPRASSGVNKPVEKREP